MANVTIIPEDYDSLKKEYLILRKELDCVNQELYGCKRQLKVVEALQHEYQSEIEILQCEESARTQKLEDKIVQLEETISSARSKYNERVQNLELEISKKEEETDNLKAEIELLKKTNIVETSTDDISKLLEEMIELRQEHDALLENEEQLKLSVDILRKSNITLEETLTECRDELSDVKESLSCKRHELFEANDLVQKLNDELFCLRSELESFKSKPLKEESQGNSLFAEVDDRRVYLQKTINNMKTDYISMKQERAKHLNTISHLKTENKTLCERWKTDVEEKEEDQHMVLKAYKDRIQILESLIEKYKKDLSAKPVVISTGTFDEIEFYQVMLNNKVKESEELRDQLASRGLNQTILSTSLKEANKEIRKWRLEATLRQCQLELKAGDSNLERKIAEKFEAEMENERIELKQSRKGPNLACRKEERIIESNVKDMIVDVKKEAEIIVIGDNAKEINIVRDHKEVITINDSVDDIQFVELKEDTKHENVSIEDQAKQKEESVNLNVTASVSEPEVIKEIKTEICVKKEQLSQLEEEKDSVKENNQIPEDKENIPVSNKAPRKVTFSQNTVSPKATDRSAMRTNCIRVAVPKPIFIPNNK